MKVLTALFLGALMTVGTVMADPRGWGEHGIPIRRGDHITWYGTMARDASGNSLVVWTDKRNGDRDVRAQLFNPAGVPQWIEDGVNIAPNDRHQDYPAAVAVNGGWIIAWLDYRFCPSTDGCGDVFAQKLDMNGNRLWADNDFTGVAVDVASRWIAETSPQIVPDGAGGAIITWVPNLAGFDIYAQHVWANGVVAWNQALPVTATGNAGSYRVAPGTDGSMLVAWCSGYNQDDVFLSRVMPDGTLPWGQAGVPVCVETHSQSGVQLCPDGADGCYVAWEDRRNGESDIYAQRMDSDGQPFWTVNGIAICTASQPQHDVCIAPSFNSGDQDGCLVAWEDERLEYFRPLIYGQKIHADSAFAWSQDGVRLSDEPSEGVSLVQPTTTTDHNGGMVTVWQRQEWIQGLMRWVLNASRVNSSGEMVWSPMPLPVGRTAVQHDQPMIGGDFGVYSVAWMQQDTTGMQSIRFQLLDHANGTRLLGEAGTSAKTGFSGYASDARCTQMSDHRTAFVWRDSRGLNQGPKLYYQITGPDGNLERAVNGEPLALNNTGHRYYSQEHPDVCEDGNGGVLVAFEDNRWGVKLIRVSQINAAGEVVSPDSGALVWNPPQGYDQQYTHICPDGEGGYYVAWSGYSEVFWMDVYVMRLDANLTPSWDEALRLTDAETDDQLAAIVPGSDNCCLLVWQSGPYTDYNISATKICPDGTVSWNDTLCGAPGRQENPVAVSDGVGGIYVSWSDSRTQANGQDIYAQRIDSDGAPYWTENGIAVVEQPENQYYPQIAMDSRGDVNIAWLDFRNGARSQVFAQKLSPDGTLRWTSNGILVNEAGQSNNLSLVASDGRNGVFPVWTDSRGYHSDAFATHLDSTGTVFNDPFWQPDSGGTVAGSSPDGGTLDLSAVSDGLGGSVIALRRYSVEHYGPSGGDYTIDLYAQHLFDYASAVKAPEDVIPADFALYQNYPNPFNPVTRIAFDLPEAGKVKLLVYDLLGRRVASLVDGNLGAGQHQVSLDASSLASGVYFYRIEAGSFVQSRKMVLLK